ncbi:LLM class flavin-dependent oxidoreductase [Corynebacterium sanguinis]|uniref:LLM class flavin-dependent oxidoreductase n=1 Tax=Corynebacterium sanguinis TaxID=2594913 RepID=A0A6C1TZT0_9CORY|nr:MULTISPECIES: LLM class flavin-dependent oxidoreductase [Corynebacterium]MCT1464233.1 LLM class flavin-dependent oxidoreductase [Corynebacterium sanguinis]MCT1554601.1 LLM class flavin-dependent oxidoreductase [Corynebacterium sanguinis]MCT1585131.1 LLM class flavin-dependent oxidoreductase [Corynebacterium sanguinis]MCT1664355.1 LLM class flavin-dependent oxidoreductase [Corynebacterium sanguinis]MCT1805363.1 LLM class flavin-dependent oxidoreductase [Corynebacterium sanguinis]
MKKFGFLSFGHYAFSGQQGPGAKQTLQDTVEIARQADAIGVNGAYVRVHHFAPQFSSPIALLSAMAAVTKHIEVGTGVLDMRYANPLQLAEDIATLDLLSNERVALGVSRGSPEPADKGWESFGFTAQADNGADLARDHLERFMAALRGEGMAVSAPLDRQYPRMYRPGIDLPVLPHSPGADRRIWWGAGSFESAEQAARDGVNLMSSTLISEADGSSLGELQARQIQRYRESWAEAGHEWTPRVSVSRSVFPIVDDTSRRLFGMQGSSEQIGSLGESRAVTFGKTYAAEPDQIIAELKADPSIQAADTLMLTIPNQLGVDLNVKILADFAEHIAPALGWVPANES